MSHLQLIDATCQVEQAQAVLSLWLERTTKDSDPDLPRLLGSIITLLNGVPEAMSEADSALHDYAMRELKEGRS
ncbi:MULTISPECIES: hypothetical protein [Klebsiella]|uniref:hypothetical protein n=1 Tax=Klebsiella TaxID=570 RepID=UPI000C435C19|nr:MULTISPECIES: hypothetical protein [Klebsiella]MBZ7457464.1 hypothetical protein [Klebsiella michiganensis]PHY98762.1 hypothetical protein CK204_19650 [Klebsiella pneumoniae]QSA79244.1 hypothetical protein JT748_19135 [Klebsiella pneumoniae]QTL14464.1 hypothetical protein J6255_19135 [Klebsiella pneumoniae]QVK28631.1 hypothetical protein KH752_07565 [Klebsiella pneumoniae]